MALCHGAVAAAKGRSASVPGPCADADERGMERMGLARLLGVPASAVGENPALLP